MNCLIEQSVIIINILFTYQRKMKHRDISKNQRRINHQNNELKKSIRKTKKSFNNEHIKKQRQSLKKIISSKQRHDRQL